MFQLRDVGGVPSVAYPLQLCDSHDDEEHWMRIDRRTMCLLHTVTSRQRLADEVRLIVWFPEELLATYILSV